MKTRSRILAVLLAACVIVTALGRTIFADEAIPSDRRLPKNTVAFVSFRDFSDFKAAWSKTVYGQLEKEESLAEFRADLEKQLGEASKQLEEQVGLSLSDLLAIPHGEIAAAGVLLPGGKLGGLLFLDFGDRQEAVQKLLDKAAESLEKQGIKRSEEEVEDIHFVVYKREGDDVDEGKKPGEVGAYVLKDSSLVIGTNSAALKLVLSRWDGKHDRVLAENEVYRYIVDRCRDENSDTIPQLTWFLDPVTLVQAIIASVPQQAAQLAMIAGALPVLGVDKFRGIGGTFDMARGEYDLVSRSLVYMERPPQGVLNLFQFDAASQTPPKWLSAEWSGYTALNWNAGKAYAGVEGLVDMFQGPGSLAHLVQQLADDERSGGIHLKKDVIDQLTGTVHFVEDDGDAKGSAAAGFLAAIGVKNAAAARATLAKVARIPGLKLEEREFQGETVYEVASGGAADDDEEEGDEGNGGRFAVAVAESHVMVASNVRLLERVLRGIGDRETLADSAAFKRIAGKFPSQTASIGFTRKDSSLSALYEMLKSGQGGNLLQGLELDFSKLPAIDTLKKYMTSSGSFMEHDPRGLRITSFSLRNEE